MNWLQQGLEARRYVTAKTTDDTEVGSLPWKNKTTIPKLTQIKDNLISFYMAALLPSDDWFIFEGDNKASHEKGEVIEAYMGTKIRNGGFRKALEQLVDDWVTYGNCFLGVDWEHTKAKSLATGQETTTFMGPRLVRISPLDCAIDPRASSFDKSPFIRRRYVSLADLVGHNDTDPSIPYNEASIADVIALRRGERVDWTEYYANAGLTVDGFQSWNDYFSSQYVELLEYWGDIYVRETGEILKGRCITIAERAFVLADVPIPTWSGRKPFAHVSWRGLPDNLYGQGPLDNLVGMQYRCDHLENLKADIYDQMAHPVIKISGDEVEDFEWGPGAKVFTGVDGDVSILQPPVQALSADNEIAFYHNMMEQMAGSPREMMGFRTPGEKTAFEVNVLQQGADRVFQNRLNRFEEFGIQPALNLMFEMIIRNLDVEDVARVFNDDTKSLVLVTITKDDVLADGTLRPVGAKHFAARNKRLQEMRTLIELGSNPSIAPHFSGLNAGEAVTQELGFEKYNIIAPNIGVMEQLETQQMVQQAQAMLQQGGGIPNGGQAQGQPEPLS